MDEKLDQAIEKVLGMVRTNMQPDEAMKISQAALNLAHVKGTLTAIAMEGKPKKQGAAA